MTLFFYAFSLLIYSKTVTTEFFEIFTKLMRSNVQSWFDDIRLLSQYRKGNTLIENRNFISILNKIFIARDCCKSLKTQIFMRKILPF